MSAKKGNRRALNWAKVRDVRSASALVIATSGGAGLLPLAPGTFGAIVGFPIAYFSNQWPLEARLALWIGLTVVGTWSAKVFDELMGSKDNQNIVIDETIGMGITAWTAGTHLLTLFVALLLFRLFDIWKPWPVRNVDRWSHIRTGQSQLDAWRGGFGVIADDIVAGFQGLIVVIILQVISLVP